MSNYGGGYGQGGYGGNNRYTDNPYAQQDSNPYDERDNQYGQQSGNPYAQQQQNPYAQRQQNNPYAQQGNYGGSAQGGYAQGNDMEMGELNGGYGAPQKAEISIRDECRDIGSGIDAIQRNLAQLRKLQSQSITSADASPTSQVNRELEALNAETMAMYRNFTQRIKKVKSTPGAGDPSNAPQVGLVERKLKDAIQQYQDVESKYRRDTKEEMVRQYKVATGADEETARREIGDGENTQVFSQALLNSNRRGQSQSALRAVEGRHQEIQKIAQQIIELNQLFEDMNVLVVQQEPVVERINEQSENVNQDVTNANEQLTGAVDKARAARKKKWICLGIVVAILVVIAIILAILFGVVRVQDP